MFKLKNGWLHFAWPPFHWYQQGIEMAGRRIGGSNWISPGPRQLGDVTAKLREQAVFVLFTIGAFRRKRGVNGPKFRIDQIRAEKNENLAVGKILQESMVPLNDRENNCNTF